MITLNPMNSWDTPMIWHEKGDPTRSEMGMCGSNPIKHVIPYYIYSVYIYINIIIIVIILIIMIIIIIIILSLIWYYIYMKYHGNFTGFHKVMFLTVTRGAKHRSPGYHPPAPWSATGVTHPPENIDWSTSISHEYSTFCRSKYIPYN